VGFPQPPHPRLILLGLALAGAVLAFLQRRELAEEWHSKWRYFLMVEGLFLGFFLLDLLIRLGNPDLWHPARGGERPMDFSYLNAVIKSTVFPPYDPWFAAHQCTTTALAGDADQILQRPALPTTWCYRPCSHAGSGRFFHGLEPGQRGPRGWPRRCPAE
jgi:hypothetical protein